MTGCKSSRRRRMTFFGLDKKKKGYIYFTLHCKAAFTIINFWSNTYFQLLHQL